MRTSLTHTHLVQFFFDDEDDDADDDDGDEGGDDDNGDDDADDDDDDLREGRVNESWCQGDLCKTHRMKDGDDDGKQVRLDSAG